jgi:type IV/VI secretion system ImpK/VasF family protein
MYLATAEVLIMASQLGTAADMPPPAQLREELLRLLRQMVAKCRAAGISDSDTAEARYALVAFIDDRILKSNWVGRGEWMNSPLQLQLFHEYAAGENFFVRMRAIQQRNRRSPALEAFHLCLALGFTGALQGPNALGESRAHLEATRDCVPRLEPGAGLSPHALPPDHYSALAPRRPLLLFLAIGGFAVVAIALTLLALSLDGAVDRAQRAMTAQSPTSATPAR